MTDHIAQPPAVLSASDSTEGMSYLETPLNRLVTLYIPLFIIVVILLFPFYWMALTSIKPDEQLIDMNTYNPFWVVHPTLKHIEKLLFETQYPRWLWNTMYVATAATFLSIVASVLAAYALVRLRFKGAQTVGGLIFLAYLVPPSILFIPLASVIQAYGLFDSPLSLILVYPTLLIPFSTWLLMGCFKTIPYELEECALIDGASRWQILIKIVLPLAVPGLIVIAPYDAADAKGLLKAAIRSEDPVVFLENELVYGRTFDIPDLDDHVLPIGKARVVKPGKDVTIVSYSIGVGLSLEAAEKLAAEGIDAEVIDLRTLRPLDKATVLESLAKTNRMIVAEEGWPTCSISSEIIAIAMEEGFDHLDAPVLRVCDEDVPLPYAANLEELALIDSDRIVAAAKKVCYRG